MRLLSTALILLAPTLASAQPSNPDWPSILSAPQVKLPAPRPALDLPADIHFLRQTTAKTNVHWETDLTRALATAKAENRPLFITLRCLPCRTCSEFDKTILEGGPDLDPLYQQFVTVRLTSVKDVDLRLLPMADFQDMDVSWWGWFLSPQGQVYAVYGGRDHVPDTTRTSKPSLIKTMQRVLQHHYNPQRKGWNIDGPTPAAGGQPQTPANLPGLQSWLKIGEHEKIYKQQNCIHCHQAAEIMRQPAIDAGTFDKTKDLDIWPFPENVGILLERDDGLLIKSITPNSPAAKAGLKPGDTLAAADNRRIFSQADFRAALHRGPEAAGSIDLWYLRSNQPANAKLNVTDGWRKTDLSWRPSIGESNIGAAPGGFWPTDGNRHREKLNIPKDKMCVEPHFGFNNKPAGAAVAAGLKQGDIITAVNGQSPPLHGRPWLVWFRLNHNPGDKITLTVTNLRTNETRDITYTATK